MGRYAILLARVPDAKVVRNHMHGLLRKSLNRSGISPDQCIGRTLFVWGVGTAYAQNPPPPHPLRADGGQATITGGVIGMVVVLKL